MKFSYRKVRGWASNDVAKVKVFEPESIEEIIQIIKNSEPNSIISRGNGRSYGCAAQIHNGNIIKLNNKSFKSIIIDDKKHLLKVGAGVIFQNLITKILSKGYFLPVTAGTSKITVGGAIAADIHGKNHPRDGSFGSYVKELLIIDGCGNLKKLKPGVGSSLANVEEFWATIGGMGLTGVIVSATFSLKKISSSFMNVYSQRFSNLYELLDNMLIREKNYNYNVAWIDCFDANFRGILTSANHLQSAQIKSSKIPKNKKFSSITLPLIFPLNLLNKNLVKIFNFFYFYNSPKNHKSYKSIQSFFYPLDKIDNWNKLYGSNGFLQYQFVIPEHSKNLIFEVLKLLKKNKIYGYLAVLKRFGNANPGYLSFPQKGWTLSIDFPKSNIYIYVILRKIDEIISASGGRLYLAKEEGRLSSDLFKYSYKKFSEWHAIKLRMDPRNIFCSDLYKKITS